MPRSRSAISTGKLCPLPSKPSAQDIPLSNVQFSSLQSAFLLAYALMYAGGGKLVGRSRHAPRLRRDHGVLVARVRQPRPGHNVSPCWRSAASCSGMGEGGGFPAATRAVAEWFPVERTVHRHGHHQRRHGGGSSRRAAAHRGDSAATPTGAWIFFFTGALGLLWTVWWS